MSHQEDVDASTSTDASRLAGETRHTPEVSIERIGATDTAAIQGFDGTFDFTPTENFRRHLLETSVPIFTPSEATPIAASASVLWNEPSPPSQTSRYATVSRDFSALHRAATRLGDTLERTIDRGLAKAGENDGLPPGNTIVIRGLGLVPRPLRSSADYDGVIESAPFAVGSEPRKVLLARDGQKWTTQVWDLFHKYLLAQRKGGRDPLEVVRSEDTKSKAETIATLSHELLTYPALIAAIETHRTFTRLRDSIGVFTATNLHRRHLVNITSMQTTMTLLYQHLASICRGTSDRTSVMLGGEEMVVGMECAALEVWELDPGTQWKICWGEGEGEVLVPVGEETDGLDARVLDGGQDDW